MGISPIGSKILMGEDTKNGSFLKLYVLIIS